jgi:hypothetical protein
LSHARWNTPGPVLGTTTGTWGIKIQTEERKSSTAREVHRDLSLESFDALFIRRGTVLQKNLTTPYLPLKEYNTVTSCSPELKKNLVL